MQFARDPTRSVDPHASLAPTHSDPDFDNIKASPWAMAPFLFKHSSWQELQLVSLSHLCSFPLPPNGSSTETTTKTATRRANTKPKDSQSSTSVVYAHVLTFFYQ